jgi:hypothetical protein
MNVIMPQFSHIDSLDIYSEIFRGGSRALHFHLSILTLPLDLHALMRKKEVNKNNSLSGIRKSCPVGQWVYFLQKKQYSVSPELCLRSGKTMQGAENSILCRRTAGKT